MNVELLLKVKEAVLEEPKRLNMWTWITTNTKADEGPKCGTVGCISGWATVIATKEASGVKTLREVASRLKRQGKYGTDAGAAVLDLTDRQARDLFMPEFWPFDLSLYATQPGTPEHAEIVARGIDRFIANGGHWE